MGAGVRLSRGFDDVSETDAAGVRNIEVVNGGVVKPSSEVSRHPPTLIAVNQVSVLPNGTAYVASFIELWEWGVVVRLVGLAGGFVRQVLDLQLELRDDQGGRYEWRTATSGGMVLPEEVMLAFDGRPSESARLLQLLVAASGDALMSAHICRFEDDGQPPASDGAELDFPR